MTSRVGASLKRCRSLARANARRGRLHHLPMKTSEVVFKSELIPRTNIWLVATQRKVNPYLTLPYHTTNKTKQHFES
jgi:hypothetical protein